MKTQNVISIFLLFVLINFASCVSHNKQVSCPTYKDNSRQLALKFKLRRLFQKDKKIERDEKKVAFVSQFEANPIIKDTVENHTLIALEDTKSNLLVCRDNNVTEYNNKRVGELIKRASIEDKAAAHQAQVNSGDDIKKEKEVKKSLKKNEKQAIGLATASLVLGILGLFVFGIPFGILAIIFGASALNRISKNPELSGKGTAIAGLVLGILDILLLLLVLAAM